MHILTLSAKKHDQHLINNSEYLHKSTREKHSQFLSATTCFYITLLIFASFQISNTPQYNCMDECIVAFGTVSNVGKYNSDWYNRILL